MINDILEYEILPLLADEIIIDLIIKGNITNDNLLIN